MVDSNKCDMVVIERMKSDDLLTPKGAGEILGVSAHRVRQFSNEGRIPCYRTTDGRRLFWKGDVEDFKETRDAEREAKKAHGR